MLFGLVLAWAAAADDAAAGACLVSCVDGFGFPSAGGFDERVRLGQPVGHGVGHPEPFATSLRLR